MDRYVIVDGEKCSVEFHKYADNGAIAIELRDSIGIPYARATVNLEVNLAPNEVAMHTTDSDDVMQALIRGGIIHIPHRYVRQGYGNYPICRIKEDVLQTI